MIAESMTAADIAVRHIIRRVQSEASFSWLMLGTESLALCIAAVAEQAGKDEGLMRRQIEANAASTREVPEVVELRRRLDQIESKAPQVVTSPAAIDRDSRLRHELEELVWAAECGANVLTLDNLKRLINPTAPY